MFILPARRAAGVPLRATLEAPIIGSMRRSVAAEIA
jgi:hypothetical protein